MCSTCYPNININIPQSNPIICNGVGIGCMFVSPGTCVNYTGINLPNSGILTNMNLDQVIQKLDTAISEGGGGSSVVEITHEELLILHQDEQLIPGQEYLITDYRTLHDIFNVAPNGVGGYTITNTGIFNEGPVAPLLVKARDQFGLFPEAKCITTNHLVLYNIFGSLPYSGSLEPKGVISRRIDVAKNVSIPYDWYVYIWRVNGVDYRPIGGQWFGGNPLLDPPFYGDNIYIGDQQEYDDPKPIVITSNSLQSRNVYVGPGLGFIVESLRDVNINSLSSVYIPLIAISTTVVDSINSVTDFTTNDTLSDVNGIGANLVIANNGSWFRYTGSLVFSNGDPYESVAGTIAFKP